MNSSGLITNLSEKEKPTLAIIGGSGICSFPELKVIARVNPLTKYGYPSDIISICEYCDQLVAFLPRHGAKHTLPPHKIPYKSNLTALKEIGVKNVVATCVVGSLKKEMAPGSLVIPDQFVNLTFGRDDCYEQDGVFIHLPMGEPYCENLRQKMIRLLNDIDCPVITNATVAVIQGPRFSTIAESKWFISNGWDVVNMTQYPECYFARELGLCYATIASITDYDVGLKENLSFGNNNTDLILKVFKSNTEKVKSFLLNFIENQKESFFCCGCAECTLRYYYESSL